MEPEVGPAAAAGEDVDTLSSKATPQDGGQSKVSLCTPPDETPSAWHWERTGGTVAGDDPDSRADTGDDPEDACSNICGSLHAVSVELTSFVSETTVLTALDEAEGAS